jgi:hypothetical protein
MKHIRCCKCDMVIRFRSYARLAVRIRAHAVACWGAT